MSTKIYRLGGSVIRDSDSLIKYSVNIDPGLNTGGITVINHLTKQIEIRPYVGDFNAMESQYPVLFRDIHESSGMYFRLIDQCLSLLQIPDLSEVEFTMEYTGTWGQYSIGLFTFLSSFNTMLYSKGIRGLTLIPPVAGKYFLFQKYKESLKSNSTDVDFDVKKLINLNNINVSKTEIKRLVESEFSEIVPKRTLKSKNKKTGVSWRFEHTNHMADSLLIAVFRHYDFFKQWYPDTTLIKPDVQLIELKA